MPDQEKKELEVDGLEVSELEDEDLEGVAGGMEPITNNSCPNTNCPCQPGIE